MIFKKVGTCRYVCGGDFGAKIELKVAKQINDHFAFSNMELVKGQ